MDNVDACREDNHFRVSEKNRNEESAPWPQTSEERKNERKDERKKTERKKESDRERERAGAAQNLGFITVFGIELIDRRGPLTILTVVKGLVTSLRILITQYF